MLPWETLDTAAAPDGETLTLRRRGDELLIVAGGKDLMSSADGASSRALADLGCAHLDRRLAARILVGGLGMGYTLRAALDRCGPGSVVEVVEWVRAVADWNRGVLSAVAGDPLSDGRTKLTIGDISDAIDRGRGRLDAILLDVDNGPDALAHATNARLYSSGGLARTWAALRPGGVLGLWSFSDDPGFTRRLHRQGFSAVRHRVPASRTGRGRHHVVWVAMRPLGRDPRSTSGAGST
ncbi:MAG: hypothetical protein V3V08_10740 [Nannocystaceae bacterium]